jgi:hypothetical protein
VVWEEKRSVTKVPAHIIAKALHNKHVSRGDYFATEVKSGSTMMASRGQLMIFDAMAISKSWTKPYVTIYEIKTSRSDFLSDTKWPRYREFCNRFLFACPANMISPDELTDGVGLITFNPDNCSLRMVRRPTFQDNPLSVKVLLYLVMSRLDQERHPFFSDTREYFEAMVNDRKEKAMLGDKVRSRLNSDNKLLRITLADTKRDLTMYKSSHDRLKDILDWFRKRQFSTYNNETLLIQLEKMLDRPKENVSVRQALMVIEAELKKIGRL